MQIAVFRLIFNLLAEVSKHPRGVFFKIANMAFIETKAVAKAQMLLLGVFLVFFDFLNVHGFSFHLVIKSIRPASPALDGGASWAMLAA